MNSLSALWAKYGKFIKDTADRTLFTFIAAFVATYAPVLFDENSSSAIHNLTSLDTLQKAAVAGLAAAVTVVRSLLSKRFGSKDSGGLVDTSSGPQVIEVPVEVPADAAPTTGDVTVDISSSSVEPAPEPSADVEEEPVESSDPADSSNPQ